MIVLQYDFDKYETHYSTENPCDKCDPENLDCQKCMNFQECYDLRRCSHCDSIDWDNDFTSYNNLTICPTCWQNIYEENDDDYHGS